MIEVEATHATIKNNEEEIHILKNKYYQRFLFFKKRLHPSMMGDREIVINKPHYEFCNNKIICSRFTKLNFLPLILIEQCSKILNIFFIVFNNKKKIQISFKRSI